MIFVGVSKIQKKVDKKSCNLAELTQTRTARTQPQTEEMIEENDQTTTNGVFQCLYFSSSSGIVSSFSNSDICNIRQ